MPTQDRAEEGPSQIRRVRRKWRCSGCGEKHADEFDVCWNCGTSRSKRAAVGAATHAIDGMGPEWEATRVGDDPSRDVARLIGYRRDGEPVYEVVGVTASGEIVRSNELEAPYNPTMNGLAIAALVFGVMGGSIIAVILGHIARQEIRERGEQGDGLALTGLIFGYVGLIVLIVVLVNW